MEKFSFFSPCERLLKYASLVNFQKLLQKKSQLSGKVIWQLTPQLKEIQFGMCLYVQVNPGGSRKRQLSNTADL